jgi:hypothetical protein
MTNSGDRLRDILDTRVKRVMALGGVVGAILVPVAVSAVHDASSQKQATLNEIIADGPAAVGHALTGDFNGQNVRIIKPTKNESAREAAFEANGRKDQDHIIEAIQAQEPDGGTVSANEMLLVPADKPYTAPVITGAIEGDIQSQGAAISSNEAATAGPGQAVTITPEQLQQSANGPMHVQ